jgi:hypothetical protein
MFNIFSRRNLPNQVAWALRTDRNTPSPSGSIFSVVIHPSPSGRNVIHWQKIIVINFVILIGNNLNK